MKIALVAAEFSSREANELRKAMATFRSKGQIGLLEEKMVGRMIRRGYDPDFARRCFDQIKGFGEYGFPESHAASFALLVYVSSWLKCHFPAAFGAALLNSQPMGFYAPARSSATCRSRGRGPRARREPFDWDTTLTPDGGAAWRPPACAPFRLPQPPPPASPARARALPAIPTSSAARPPPPVIAARRGDAMRSLWMTAPGALGGRALRAPGPPSLPRRARRGRASLPSPAAMALPEQVGRLPDLRLS
jgi:error-prone DNA polymerase